MVGTHREHHHYDRNKGTSALRILRLTALSLLALVLLAFALVQFQQHLLRHRAEKLNADIAWLRDHPGTWEDLQRMQRRWGAFAHYDGTCDQRHCDYVIYLTTPFDAFIFRDLWHPFHPNQLTPIYEKLGGREGWVDADIRLTDNHIWGTRIDIYADTPIGGLLAAGVYLGPRLFTSFGLPLARGRQEAFTSAIARRGYLIPPTNRYPWKWVSMTPSTPKADRDRLSVIHFSCLSSIRPCTSVSELVPNAEAQYTADHAQQHDDYRNQDCQIPLAMHASEADTVLKIEVLSSGASDDALPTEEKRYLSTINVLEKLKGPSRFQIGDTVEVLISDYPHAFEGIATNKKLPLSIGSQWILLLRNVDVVIIPGRQHHPYIQAFLCTVVPDSDATRAEIAKGIADDPSNGEEYNPAHHNLPWASTSP